MSIILVAASMLTVSPLNVRKTQNEAANQQLRADIVARGVIQNLVGVPVPRKKGRYEVTAGGRRLTQIHAAIAAGELPADFMVPLLPFTDRDDAEEASLAENFQREPMNPADECVAFRHIIEREGKNPADVAKRFGLTERFVLGRLRLAGLAEVVFDALRDGELTLDLAMAYAATSDTIQQAAVFERNKHNSYGVNEHTIRRLVTEAGYAGSHPRALLVGRDAYVEAGGRVDGDLFSDAANETWLDRGLLDSLYDAKVRAILDAATTQNGYGSARWAEDEHAIWNVKRGLVAIKGAVAEPCPEELERKADIERALADLEAASASDEGLNADQHQRADALREELDLIERPEARYSDEQKRDAIVVVYQGRDGQVYAHPELYRDPAAASVEHAPVTDVGEAAGHDPEGETRTTADRIVAEQPSVVAPPAPAPEKGLTDRHARELAQQKAELVAIHVANDPHFALDLAVFVMADRACGNPGALPSELRADEPSFLPDFTSGTQAAVEWGKLEDGLDRSWKRQGDPAARFDAFRALPDEERAAWLGWCVARTIAPVKHGEDGSAFTDHLGSRLGIDVAAWWRPTGLNYFDRVSKPTILRAFRAVGGSELSVRYSASKKTDLSVAAERLFRGDTIVEAETKANALAWLPREMAFDASEAIADTSDVEGVDAALESSEQPGQADGPVAPANQPIAVTNPRIAQYRMLKGGAEGALLLYRSGNFFELYSEDAIVAAAVLEVALTSASFGDEAVPSCGIPVHSATSHIDALLRAGHKVAVAEQTESNDAAHAARGPDAIAERVIVRIVTASDGVASDLAQAA